MAGTLAEAKNGITEHQLLESILEHLKMAV
jgi:hypothetical protein